MISVRIAGLAVAVGAMALPGIASAHTADLSAECYAADNAAGTPLAQAGYRFNRFPVGVDSPVAYTFSVDGVVIDDDTTTLHPLTRGPVFLSSSYREVTPGTHTARVTARWDLPTSRGSRTLTTTIVCPQPIVPVPTPAPVPPAPEVVPALSPPTAIAPPKPNRPKVTKPKRPITCAYLRSVGAGPRWYTARGWYYRCRAPRRVPNPTPPVTG